MKLTSKRPLQHGNNSELSAKEVYFIPHLVLRSIATQILISPRITPQSDPQWHNSVLYIAY